MALITFLCLVFTVISFDATAHAETLNSPFYVIGVDAGTESCRVGIFDLASDKPGTPTSQSSAKYKTTFPQPGFAEQNPVEWWESFGTACKQAIFEGNIDIESIHAISVDTTACSVVCLDRKMNPLRNCLLWMDTRASLQCDEILNKAIGDPALRVNNQGKGPLSAEWMIPKALWIKQKERSLWNRIHVLCEKQDYFNFKLTNRICASGCNVAARWHWNAEESCQATRDKSSHKQRHAVSKELRGRPVSLLQKIGLLDALDKWPRDCVAMGETVGYLTAAAAQHLGLKAGIRCVQGGPDAYVAMLGLGCIESGQLALITGSSHLHLAISPTSTDGTCSSGSSSSGSSSSSIGIDGNNTTDVIKDRIHTHGSRSSNDCIHINKKDDNDYSAAGIWGNYYGAPLLGLSFAEGGQSSTGSMLNWYKNMITSTPTDTNNNSNNSNNNNEKSTSASTNINASNANDNNGGGSNNSSGNNNSSSCNNGSNNSSSTNSNNNNNSNSISMKSLDMEASHIPIGSNGLLVYEKFQGSRTPVTDAAARGALLGLTLSHNRSHVWRAMMESICYGTYDAILSLQQAGFMTTSINNTYHSHSLLTAATDGNEQLQNNMVIHENDETNVLTSTSHSLQPSEILIGGGAVRSDIFCQMHADVTGMTVVIGEVDNCALLGSGILAAVGSGYYDDDDNTIDTNSTSTSNNNNNNKITNITNNISSSSDINDEDASSSSLHRQHIKRAIFHMVKVSKRLEPDYVKHKIYKHYFHIYKQAALVIQNISHALVSASSDVTNMLQLTDTSSKRKTSIKRNQKDIPCINKSKVISISTNNSVTTDIVTNIPTGHNDNKDTDKDINISIPKKKMTKKKTSFKWIWPFSYFQPPQQHQNPILISPSLLSADYSALSQDTQACITAMTEMSEMTEEEVTATAAVVNIDGDDNNITKISSPLVLHVDMCDGVAVPGSLTFGPKTVADLRVRFPSHLLHIDVHLVVDPAAAYSHIQQLADAGATRIIFQYEQYKAGNKGIEIARYIRSLNMRVGVCISPESDVMELKPLLAEMYNTTNDIVITATSASSSSVIVTHNDDDDDEVMINPATITTIALFNSSFNVSESMIKANHPSSSLLSIDESMVITLIETSPSSSPLIEMVDILAVHPGFAGQLFNHSVLSKVKYLRHHYPQLIHIAVDGGINTTTAVLAAKAGADLLIAGSSVFYVKSTSDDGNRSHYGDIKNGNSRSSFDCNSRKRSIIIGENWKNLYKAVNIA